MKITKIEAHQIETPRVTGHISGHLIVKVHVDDGPIGLGEASDSKCSDVAAVVRQYNELLVGRDPTRITETNEFLRTHNFESTVSNHHLVSAIDLALYDLNGKALGVPAYRLLGGKFRDKIYCCFPTWGVLVKEDYEATAGYLQRLVDHGHHLFRFYISGDDAEFDNRFLTDMFCRFGDKIRLKQIDFSGRFSDWQTALRYADVLRHHTPGSFRAAILGPPGLRRIHQAYGPPRQSPYRHPRTRSGIDRARRLYCLQPVQCLLGPHLHPSPLCPGRIRRHLLYHRHRPGIHPRHRRSTPSGRLHAQPQPPVRPHGSDALHCVSGCGTHPRRRFLPYRSRWPRSGDRARR